MAEWPQTVGLGRAGQIVDDYAAVRDLNVVPAEWWEAAVSEALMMQDYEAENNRLADLARELYEAAKESDRMNLSHDSLNRARARYEQEVGE